MIKFSITAFLVTALSLGSFADEKTAPQPEPVTSVKPITLKPDTEKKWFFSVMTGYGLTAGNTGSHNADAGVAIEYENGLMALNVNADYHYGELAGVRSKNNFSGSVLYDYYLHRRWEIFVFTKCEFDSPASLIFRNNTGAGIKFVIFNNWFWKMDISAAPVFQYQVTNIESFDPRISFRYRVNMTPWKILTVKAVLFFIPNMLNFANYRYEFEASARLALKEFTPGSGTGLFFNIGYSRKYDTSPATGKVHADSQFFSALSLKI